jgi:hypothetical protein
MFFCKDSMSEGKSTILFEHPIFGWGSVLVEQGLILPLHRVMKEQVSKFWRPQMARALFRHVWEESDRLLLERESGPAPGKKDGAGGSFFRWRTNLRKTIQVNAQATIAINEACHLYLLLAETATKFSTEIFSSLAYFPELAPRFWGISVGEAARLRRKSTVIAARQRYAPAVHDGEGVADRRV